MEWLLRSCVLLLIHDRAVIEEISLDDVLLLVCEVEGWILENQ